MDRARQLRGFGVVIKLGADSSRDALQMRRLRELGASLICWQPEEWSAVERQPGKYTLEAQVWRSLTQFKEARLRPIVILFRANPLYSDPLDPAAFARYAGWMARAFRHAPVAAYQIWNEPVNFDVRDRYGGSWNGTDGAPWVGRFSEMVRQAAAAIRQADARAVIIHNLEGPPWIYAMRNTPDDFVDIDGVGLHPYPFQLPPERVPWGSDAAARDGVAVADPDGSLLSYIRVQTIDAPQKYLHRPLSAWVTEYGYPTCDPAVTKSMYACVDPQRQAAYHARALLQAFSEGVRAWCVYEFADSGDDPSDAEDNFGLVRSAAHGYAPKLAFYTLRRLAEILGSDWRFLPTPGIEWLSHGESTAKVKGSNQQPSSIEGPQLFCFSASNRLVAFIWRAGADKDGQATARVALGWKAAPGAAAVVSATDLVTGGSVHPRVYWRDRTLVVDDLPLTGRPIAVQLSPRP